MAGTVEQQITALVDAEDFNGLVALCDNFELDLGHSEAAPHISAGVYKARATHDAPGPGGR